MTLQSSGELDSIDVLLEIGKASNAPLNSAEVTMLQLAGKTAGQQYSSTDLYGKAYQLQWEFKQGLLPNSFMTVTSEAMSAYSPLVCETSMEATDGDATLRHRHCVFTPTGTPIAGDAGGNYWNSVSSPVSDAGKMSGKIGFAKKLGNGSAQLLSLGMVYDANVGTSIEHRWRCKNSAIGAADSGSTTLTVTQNPGFVMGGYVVSEYGYGTIAMQGNGIAYYPYPSVMTYIHATGGSYPNTGEGCILWNVGAWLWGANFDGGTIAPLKKMRQDGSLQSQTYPVSTVVLENETYPMTNPTKSYTRGGGYGHYQGSTLHFILTSAADTVITVYYYSGTQHSTAILRHTFTFDLAVFGAGYTNLSYGQVLAVGTRYVFILGATDNNYVSGQGHGGKLAIIEYQAGFVFPKTTYITGLRLGPLILAGLGGGSNGNPRVDTVNKEVLVPLPGWVTGASNNGVWLRATYP